MISFWIFNCFLIICVSSFENTMFISISHFLNWVICFLVVHFFEFFVYLRYSPSKGYIVGKNLSPSCSLLLCLNNVFSAAQELFIFMRSLVVVWKTMHPKRSGTVVRCGFGRVDMALLEEVHYYGGELWVLIHAWVMPSISVYFLLPRRCINIFSFSNSMSACMSTYLIMVMN